jgi:hypothetical protein
VCLSNRVSSPFQTARWATSRPSGSSNLELLSPINFVSSSPPGSSLCEEGRTVPPGSNRLQHSISLIQKAVNHALRGCLPVWKTTPLPALYREASVPPVEQLLGSARVRHAMRLRTLDKQHPLVHRSTTARTTNGATARSTILQFAITLVQEFPRPVLQQAHYSGSSHTDYGPK